MEHPENNLSPKVQTGTLGIMSMIVALGFIILVVFIIYYNVLKLQSEKEITSLDKKITEVKDEIIALEKKDVQKVFIAAQYLKTLEQNQVMWSEFLTRLNEITPEEIRYSSFSATETGDVTVSAFAPTFRHVANLIRDVQKNSYFKEIFVPSLSRGTDISTRDSEVSFGINMKYIIPRKQLREPSKKSVEKVSSTSFSLNFDPHVPLSTLRSKFRSSLVSDTF